MEVFFNKEEWNTTNNRLYLANKLIRENFLLGYNKREVVDLLGDEFNDTNSERWSYYLGTSNYWISFRKRKLWIFFNKQGLVVKVFQK